MDLNEQVNKLLTNKHPVPGRFFELGKVGNQVCNMLLSTAYHHGTDIELEEEPLDLAGYGELYAVYLYGGHLHVGYVIFSSPKETDYNPLYLTMSRLNVQAMKLKVDTNVRLLMTDDMLCAIYSPANDYVLVSISLEPTLKELQ